MMWGLLHKKSILEELQYLPNANSSNSVHKTVTGKFHVSVECANIQVCTEQVVCDDCVSDLSQTEKCVMYLCYQQQVSLQEQRHEHF